MIMDSGMIEAIQAGNIEALYVLIQGDPYALDSIDQVPFVETPLHLAACTDHLAFLLEMISLKPSFARKLNQDGFSPMHLALQKGKHPMVLQLLKFDKDLVRVKGKEGMTPLHHAIKNGNSDILIKFLDVCPEAIQDVTVREETAFHIALKHKQFEAFEVLAGWLRRSCHKDAESWKRELLMNGDFEGNTVLHIAVIQNRHSEVKLLLENFSHAQINVKNSEGWTALDIARSEHENDESKSNNREIYEMLSNATFNFLHPVVNRHCPDMDESLIRAAKEGKVRDLYSLIQGDGNILMRNIDEVEFADTPLHIAASEGCIDFAMEIMNLKPSFARKLNQQGLSPIHLAIERGQKEMALSFLEVDKDLARVRGKKGKTVLHYISEKGDDLLEKILEVCPKCMQDVTTKNRTALHIAAKHKRLDVLKVLLQTLKKTEYCQEVVNRKDKDGNTALHIAAMKNEPQIQELLLKYEADKYLKNQAGKTALEVAKDLNNRESINILGPIPFRRVSTLYYELKQGILKHVTRASSIIFHDMDNISSDDRNALLVILGLLLTATYQASLSPPGSVSQGDDNDSSSEKDQQGKSVMDSVNFLLFYIPTSAVFMVTFFLTLGLLKPYPHGFRTALQVLLAFLAVCFGAAVSFIAPTETANIVINTISGMVFFIMMFMCLAYRVSRISVSILGCWLMAGGLFPYYFIVRLFTVFWLFHFLYDEFWKGTVIAIGYCLSATYGRPTQTGILLGCWFFLGLCRFCLQRRRFLYKRWNSMI